MNLLPHVVCEPARNADSAVIWLHGLGASGHDFEPIVPYLGLGSDSQTRFLFPHAEEMPVTVNGRMRMPAWFDIYSIDIDRRIDEEGLRNAARHIDAFIDRELERGVPSERILLAGFSQGGAVAYEVALRHTRPLGGLLALSTYFATAQSIKLSDANRKLPVLIHHGTRDDIVPELLGQRSRDTLLQSGYQPVYRSWPMAHEVCAAQIAEIGKWIREQLA